MTNDKISPKVIGAIIATGIMSFCGVVVETAMNITFPKLMQQFGVSTSTVQWMTTIYLLIVAMIVPLSAVMKRSFRTKSLFITANLLFIIGLVLDAAAPIFPILLLGRVVQGVGTGIALPLMFNIILEQVPESKIGMMMGVGALITAIAPAVGPTFGGFVVSTLGWRFIFIFLLPILVISLIIGLISIQQKSEVHRTKFDLMSMLWVAITFIGLVYGFSSMGKGTFFSVESVLPIVIGIIALFLLVHRSNHISKPIIHLDILKNGLFSGHLLAFFSLQLLTLGLSFVLPNYVQLVNHNSASLAGIIVFPGAAIGAVFAPFGGRILDKFGARKPILTGSCFCLVAMLLFVIFGENLSNLMILAFYFLYMICVGLSFGNIMTSGLSHLSDDRQADGNAILTTLQQLSGAVGTSVVSAIVAHAQASSAGSKTVLTAIGSEHAFWFMLILALVEAITLFKVVKDNQD